jgi:hypothetical protein
MKPPIFVRKLSTDERKRLEAGLRSKDTFTLRRSQMPSPLRSNFGKKQKSRRSESMETMGSSQAAIGKIQRLPLREVWKHEAPGLHHVAAGEPRRTR